MAKRRSRRPSRVNTTGRGQVDLVVGARQEQAENQTNAIRRFEVHHALMRYFIVVLNSLRANFWKISTIFVSTITVLPRLKSTFSFFNDQYMGQESVLRSDCFDSVDALFLSN
jgi:hypothetical protein